MLIATASVGLPAAMAYSFIRFQVPLAALQIVSVAFLIASLGGNIWTIVDAARRPDVQWQRARRSKAAWIVAAALSLAFCGMLGLTVPVVYAGWVRPELQRHKYPPPALPLYRR